MLYEIIHLIVDVVGGLVVGACLLRAWMQVRRIPGANPVGTFVMSLTDWIVRRLRRVVPAYRGVDWASIVAALLITLVAVVIDLSLRFGGVPPPELIVGVTIVWLIKWTLYLAQLLILIAAVLSWVNPFSPFLPVFDALTRPLLAPIRRVLPQSGRMDFSPLVALLVIQVALIVVNRIAYQAIGVM
ncbi:MAG: YggT family protein [Burkholderiaceae bacterium]